MEQRPDSGPHEEQMTQSKYKSNVSCSEKVTVKADQSHKNIPQLSLQTPSARKVLPVTAFQITQAFIFPLYPYPQHDVLQQQLEQLE